MSKKKQDIQTMLNAKSFASLDREIEKILAAEKKDRPVEELLKDISLTSGSLWGSGGPPHMVKGQIIE